MRAAPALHGEVLVPGDKSITHRAVMLNAIASGTATVTGAGLGADCLSTTACMRSLGATVRRRWPDGATGDDLRRHPHSGEEERAGAVLLVEGAGAGGLTEPADVLDAGNSGTTARLLSGILAGQPFFSVLNGDASLRSRPMGRVVQPLRQMGARIEARREGTLLPLAVSPSSLRGTRLELGVASAQLKSCLLLAGLYARGTTEIVQPEGSRDHTERLLRAQGARITEGGRTGPDPGCRRGGQPAGGGRGRPRGHLLGRVLARRRLHPSRCPRHGAGRGDQSRAHRTAGRLAGDGGLDHGAQRAPQRGGAGGGRERRIERPPRG